jgi:hypothetical protein
MPPTLASVQRLRVYIVARRPGGAIKVKPYDAGSRDSCMTSSQISHLTLLVSCVGSRVTATE